MVGKEGKEEFDTVMMRVHISLKKRIEKFVKEFNEIHGTNISITQGTKILDDKISKAGGLRVKL